MPLDPPASELGLPASGHSPSAAPRRAHTFLGRLAQAVREENWFAVALEVCIVVLGVFLGIQFGNWNEARKDQAREREVIERPVADFRRLKGPSRSG